MNHCENCGLPEWAVTGVGLPVKITVKAENRFKRDSTKNVWACSEECAAQTFGIYKYGKRTSDWPVTRAQLRAMYRKTTSGATEEPKASQNASNRSQRASRRQK